jgi:hypothetical protein
MAVEVNRRYLFASPERIFFRGRFGQRRVVFRDLGVVSDIALHIAAQEVALLYMQCFTPGGQARQFIRVIGPALFQSWRYWFLGNFFHRVMIGRRGWVRLLSGLEWSSLKKFAVIRRTRSHYEIREKAGQRDQPKRARKRREIGITEPEKHRSEGQKNSKAPPNAHAESRADKKNSANQDADDADPEENERNHAQFQARVVP